jgi:predicted nucleic acid-binding protein
VRSRSAARRSKASASRSFPRLQGAPRQEDAATIRRVRAWLVGNTVETGGFRTGAELTHDLEEIERVFRHRVIPVDAAIADEWGHLNAIRPLPVIDSLLAATAKVRTLTLVTRNPKAPHGLGVRILDPFR